MAILPHKCTIHTRIQRIGSTLLLKHPVYYTFHLNRTILLHISSKSHHFTTQKPNLLHVYANSHQFTTQTHSNPLKSTQTPTLLHICTILLHKSQIYYTFTIIRTRLLHIYHLTRPSMRLASQNQEIEAKKKSRFMGPIPEQWIPTVGDAALGFQGTRSILGENFLLAETKSQQLLATICVVNFQKSTYKVHF
jgi:hypothetical protein